MTQLRGAAPPALLLLLAVLPAALALAAFTAAAADTQAPVLLGVTPADGGFVNASRASPGGLVRVEVEAQLTDLESQLSPDNVSMAVFVEGTSDPLFQEQYFAQPGVNAAVVDVFGLYRLADGPYQLFLSASDASGNFMSHTSSFLVDSQAPQVEVAAPASTNQSTIHVRIDMRDNGSGVALPAVLSYHTACSYSWFTVQVETIELPGRVVGDAAVPVCVGANNQFTVVVNDRAGNTATATRTGIACDLAGPSFSGFDPKSFDRLEGPAVVASVQVSDDASGVDPARVEYRVSSDGGVSWGAWSAANVRNVSRSLRANATIVAPDGATVALEWRAWDLAGNGPSNSRTEFFYLNGPPFLEDFAPDDGTIIFEYNEIRINASADDPDADDVSISVSSDIDGALGKADNRPVRLSLGIHNLTVTLTDGHGHSTKYVYQVQVVARPPPDPRPLMLTAILGGVMVWFAYAAYTKDEEPEVAPA